VFKQLGLDMNTIVKGVLMMGDQDDISEFSDEEDIRGEINMAEDEEEEKCIEEEVQQASAPL